ncbi:MAG: four helix bundle protein [Patescibacteria group bacterium]|uniref:Four helix bundle protein n=1 Tax=Candidatus Magasanikbacteria bacterium CG10_big_fil_rev_8_21_14_0_10_36_16 TaxID=1974645 RepID=A0A2H0TZ96_9BACT|nr:four helix bundle protein [Patescibacteria group bacterium]PIR78540.1 MAG: four helix bundle protein [Candidatus Magasanikbacteria bacterium CG10_big_fil_rev_8_21_14_0_10_36_16]
MLENTMSEFQNKLKKLMHSYVKCAYEVTKKFPKEELYSSVSQLRRSSMSVILNFVEGYGRRRDKVKLNFYEMSYGSLNESKYIFYFALDENWIEHKDYKKALDLGEEIGAMLWSEIKSVEKNIN